MIIDIPCCTNNGVGFPSLLFFNFFIKDQCHATQYMGRFVVYLKFYFYLSLWLVLRLSLFISTNLVKEATHLVMGFLQIGCQVWQKNTS